MTIAAVAEEDTILYCLYGTVCVTTPVFEKFGKRQDSHHGYDNRKNEEEENEGRY